MHGWGGRRDRERVRKREGIRGGQREETKKVMEGREEEGRKRETN